MPLLRVVFADRDVPRDRLPDVPMQYVECSIKMQGIETRDGLRETGKPSAVQKMIWSSVGRLAGHGVLIRTSLTYADQKLLPHPICKRLVKHSINELISDRAYLETRHILAGSKPPAHGHSRGLGE